MELLIIALAAWRLTSLLNVEAGPYNVLSKFRHLVGIRIDEYGQPYGTNQLAEMVNCSWCLSLWVGLAWAIGYITWEYTWLVALPFALSASAIVIERVIE